MDGISLTHERPGARTDEPGPDFFRLAITITRAYVALNIAQMPEQLRQESFDCPAAPLEVQP